MVGTSHSAILEGAATWLDLVLFGAKSHAKLLLVRLKLSNLLVDRLVNFKFVVRPRVLALGLFLFVIRSVLQTFDLLISGELWAVLWVQTAVAEVVIISSV